DYVISAWIVTTMMVPSAPGTFAISHRLLAGLSARVQVASKVDNYTFAQPGIQMKVKMLEELVSRID
ncbi:hypothetical protein P7K49_003222, partial [Saguinus oedipus]